MEKVANDDQKVWIIKLGNKITNESLKKMTNLIRFEKNKTEFILCSCQSEILYLTYDLQDKVLDFCIFYNNYNGLSLWQKIKYIWQILVTGKPYGDQLVLTNKQIKQLKDYLDNLT